MDATTIRQALRRRYPAPRYATFSELACGTGSSDGASTVIDLWVMSLWPSDALRRISIEIKVSRGDFTRELKKPNKRRRAVRYSNQFYFAAPRGLIKAEELPVEAGLLEIDGHGRARETVPAPHRETFPPTWEFMAVVMRRVDWLQSVDVDEAKRRVMAAKNILEPAAYQRKWGETLKQLGQQDALKVLVLLKDAFKAGDTP